MRLGPEITAQPSPPPALLQAATKLPSFASLYVHIQGKFTNIQGKSKASGKG